VRNSTSDGKSVRTPTDGFSGSGKSSLSKAVIKAHPGFERISFDGITAARHGLYGIDYPAAEHDKISDETDKVFFETAKDLLTQGRDVVLDRAFYAKEDRDAYRALVEEKGARWVLVYLKAPKEVLWQRIGARREAGVNADCALEISRELLDMFYDNFEVPDGEGEIVVDTDA
jgi:predicted kinase